MTWAERAKAAISQKGQSGTVNTDETAVTRLLAVSAVVTEAASAVPEGLSSILAVPPNLVLEKHDACTALTQDLDRWCWPHSPAMNGSEIETFEIRMHQFTQKGLALKDAEVLADELMFHDRGPDKRHVCLECQHLIGLDVGAWRCANWQVALITIRLRDAQLHADLALQLQNCRGFNAQLKRQPVTESDDDDPD
jgi:hypothetical protein